MARSPAAAAAPGTPPDSETMAVEETPGKAVRWVDEKDKLDNQRVATGQTVGEGAAAETSGKGPKKPWREYNPPWWAEKRKKLTTWKGSGGKAKQKGSNSPKGGGKATGKTSKGAGKKGKKSGTW